MFIDSKVKSIIHKLSTKYNLFCETVSYLLMQTNNILTKRDNINSNVSICTTIIINQTTLHTLYIE